uniref:Uncharacterized protein n=1 Tax=Parascaris univalens TaxID=6257 RepID=A0A915A4X1_PARUN
MCWYLRYTICRVICCDLLIMQQMLKRFVRLLYS